MKKFILAISVMLAAAWVAPMPAAGMISVEQASAQTAAPSSNQLKTAKSKYDKALTQFEARKKTLNTKESVADRNKLKTYEEEFRKAIKEAKEAGVPDEVFAGLSPELLEGIVTSTTPAPDEEQNVDTGDTLEQDTLKVETDDLTLGYVEEPTSSENGVPAYLTIWLILLTIGIAAVYYLLNKKLDALSRLMEDRRNEEKAKRSNESMTLADAQHAISRMGADIAALRRDLDAANARISKFSSSKVSGSHSYGIDDNQNQYVNPQKPKMSAEEVYYTDSLNQSGNGELSIPMQVLSDKDAGQLFKVTVNLNSGTGKYTINPKASNLMGQAGKLQIYTDGLTSLDGSSIKVEKEGVLKRNGYNLNVVSKLVIKCE